jgi:hypothetical protein
MGGCRNIYELQHGNVNRFEVKGRAGIHHIILNLFYYLGLLIEQLPEYGRYSSLLGWWMVISGGIQFKKIDNGR